MNGDVAYLFVYGGLMRGFDLHGHLAGCTFAGDAWLQGILMRVGRYPGLIDGDGRVQGELYMMSDPPALLEALDELEDFDPLHPETSVYVRVARDVHVHGGAIVSAWAYTYNREVSGLAIVTGGDWRRARPAQEDR